MIKLVDVCKVQKGKRLLKNINLEIKKGEIFALLESDNSRKSLLLKLMLGLAKRTTGEIYFFDKPIDDGSYLEKVGVCTDDVNFYTELSGFENIQMALSVYKKNFDKNHILNYFKMFSLLTDKDMPVNRYSPGMVQKLRLIRAFVTEPQIVILDEPSKALDPVMVNFLREYIVELSKQGVTFVIGTSMLNVIGGLADRISVMHYGEIIETISTKELKANRRAFLAIKSNQLPYLLMILERKLGIFDYEVHDEEEVHIIEDFHRKDIIRTLYHEGVDIYEVRYGLHSMESYFLDKIGD